MGLSQTNTQYCIQNAVFVGDLLQRRGGWRWRDCYVELSDDGPGRVRLISDLDESKDFLLCRWDNLVWLPTSDDALEMLMKRGIHPNLLSTGRFREGISWLATDGVFIIRGDCHKTPLIALLELLRAEGESSTMNDAVVWQNIAP